MSYTLFYKANKHLQRVLPLPYPVRIRRVPLPKTIQGDCCFRKKIFFVRIEKKLPEHLAIDVLLHEYGHCLAWSKEPDDHGPIWGEAYSLVYRTFWDWHEKNRFI